VVVVVKCDAWLYPIGGKRESKKKKAKEKERVGGIRIYE